jgi:hypothetical protein
MACVGYNGTMVGRGLGWWAGGLVDWWWVLPVQFNGSLVSHVPSNPPNRLGQGRYLSCRSPRRLVASSPCLSSCRLAALSRR